MRLNTLVEQKRLQARFDQWLNCAIEVTVKPNHWRIVTWYRIGALRFIYLILLSKQVYFLWSINIVSFISASSQVLWCHLDSIYDCSYDIYVMQKFLPWFMVSAKLPTKQAFFFRSAELVPIFPTTRHFVF